MVFLYSQGLNWFHFRHTVTFDLNLFLICDSELEFVFAQITNRIWQMPKIKHTTCNGKHITLQLHIEGYKNKSKSQSSRHPQNLKRAHDFALYRRNTKQ